MRNTVQLRDVWAPACKLRPFHLFHFWNGVRVTIDGRCAEAYQALNAILRAWNYAPKEGQTWGYNCRKITGGSGYSLHAYGIAVDINSLANPYGARLVTDMPPGMVAQIKAVRTKGGHRVFGWGGDYGRNKDAMHFEVVASPAELATGIEPAATVAATVTPTPQQEDDDLTDPERQMLADLHAWMSGPGKAIPGRLEAIETTTAHLQEQLAHVQGPALGEARRNIRRVGKAVNAEGIEGTA